MLPLSRNWEAETGFYYDDGPASFHLFLAEPIKQINNLLKCPNKGP